MKLKKLEVSSFAGISPHSPVILDFSQSKFITATGDNGVGKTSLLNALLVACGQLSHTGKDGKNFINQDTDKIDINFEFVGKDRCNYVVRCTKSKFELTYEGEAVPEPITKMKELLGVVGVSPMEIKNRPLKEIVKWLASYGSKSAEDFDKQLDKLKKGIKTSVESRASANRSLKGLNEFLENEPMYNDWEGSEKKYIQAPDIKELSRKLTDAGNKSDKFIQNEAKVKAQQLRKEQIDEQISKLNKEAEEVNGNISVGKKWLEDNKTAKKDYDDVKKKYDTAAQDVSDFNKWQEIKRKKLERDEFETLSQKADNAEKELLKEVKELQAEILPDIKGVELITEDTQENGKLIKEGLYWNGKNTAQLSESEFWKLVLEIWRKFKVKVIVIDNFQSLGTMAVEILERLEKDGAYILAAEMDRKTKSLNINYE